MYDDVVKLHFLQPPAQALDELAAVISAVERGDDAVIILYLLGSILDHATNKTSLPIRVTTTDNLRPLHALYFIGLHWCGKKHN